MTLTTTIIERTTFGDMKVVFGYCTNDSTSGDVPTGLNHVNFFIANPIGSTAAEFSVDEESYPCPGDVSVVTENGVGFVWMAIGK